MNSGRLLQCLDHMSQEFQFHLTRVGQTVAIGDVKVANHALAALVNEKGITEDASALDGRITGQNLGVNVAKNHFRGAGVVPRELARPELRLVVEQRAQVHRGKMPEVENFQNAPAELARVRDDSGKPECSAFRRQEANGPNTG